MINQQCFDLVDKDWLSKSDPVVIVQESKKPEGPWTLVGRTELIKDNQNPVFTEKIMMVTDFFNNADCEKLHDW
jgi:hypothetical protein